MAKKKGMVTNYRDRFNIEELDAMSTAYGKPLSRKDYIVNVGTPGVIFAAITFLLFYNPIVSAIAAVIGMYYGIRNYMPAVISRRYHLAGLNARGHYMTVTTQIATNDEKSMLMVLRESVDRIEKNTELYEEMIELVANIGTNIRPANVRRQFGALRHKYRYDSIFCQYLEQLETGLLNGNNNIDTLQEIESYHTGVRNKTQDFLKRKDTQKRNYTVIGAWVVALVAGCGFLLGLEAFQAGFSNHPVGWIFGGVFLLVEVRVYLSFFRDYWDDDVMSVGSSRSKRKKTKAKG